MMSLKKCYESLKGTRTRGGELFITDFSEEDYERLLEMVLEVLSQNVQIHDYYQWIKERARAWHKFRLANRNRPEFDDPLLEKSAYDYTIQEQLAIIKHYLYRTCYSSYQPEKPAI